MTIESFNKQETHEFWEIWKIIWNPMDLTTRYNATSQTASTATHVDLSAVVIDQRVTAVMKIVIIE